MNTSPCHHAGTTIGFAVEARLQGLKPNTVAGQVLDNRWSAVSFANVPPGRGVPMPSFRGDILNQCSLYTYAVAQALRWWFQAQVELETGGYDLETRLIQYKVTHRVEWQAEEAVDYEGTWESKPDSADAP